MMPVPSHLQGLVVPLDSAIDEEALSAGVRCPCGDERFELLDPGHTHKHERETIPCTAEIDGKFFFVLKSRCVGCAREHLLFDKDFHGWDGTVETAAGCMDVSGMWRDRAYRSRTHS